MISSITCRCHASSRHALTRPVRPSTGLLYSTGGHHRAAVARRYSFRIGHALTVTSLDLKGKINASRRPSPRQLCTGVLGLGAEIQWAATATQSASALPILISSAIMDGRPLAGRSASSRAQGSSSSRPTKGRRIHRRIAQRSVDCPVWCGVAMCTHVCFCRR
jgi:hypothetical protein